MMRWKMGDAGFEVKSADSAVSTTTDERLGPGMLLDHVIASLAATLARVGVTSVVVALTVAFVIATVLFGLSAESAQAFGQWCRTC